MSVLKQLYKYIQALSLDVAFGATVMSAFVSHLLEVAVPVEVYLSLFVAVWLIYTIDHLIDAKRITGSATSFRHTLHQKYFRELTSFWLIAFLFGVIFTLMVLPKETIEVGVLASALVIVHLVLVYLLGTKVSIFVQKELGVAFTYCVGIAVGPVSLSNGLDGFGYFFLFQIFLLALLNLLEFSWFDRKMDQQQQQTSFVRTFGEKAVLDVVFFLFALFVLSLVVAFLFFPEYGSYEIMLGLMGMTLFGVFAFQKYFKHNERYRIIGDLVFLFPVVLLIQF